MRPWAAPTLAGLLALLLAGCADGGGPAAPSTGTDGPAGEHGGHAAGTHLLAPTHALGDWWALESPNGRSTYVVAGEAGPDWVMATDNPDTAFFDARSDISFLGPVRKSDLAGSQGSERVEYFRFPLQADATWTTRWDGLDVTVLVTEVAEGVAQLEARRPDGALHASYTYDESLRYFGRIDFHGDDGGVAFGQEVVDSGTAFAGDLVRWELTTAYERSGPLEGGGATSFTVQPGGTDVFVEVGLACSAGAFSILVGATTGVAQERGFAANGPCPVAFNESAVLPAPAEPEPWGAILAPAPTTQMTLDIVVLARTQSTFKVGEATA